MKARELEVNEAERHLRADAQRNRARLLEAAAAVFAEHGLEVSVGEVALRAGVGRATVFRNFPTKQDLIAAIVRKRIDDAIAAGRALLADGDPGESLFGFIGEIVGRHQIDRPLFEACADEFLVRPEMRAGYTQMLEVLDSLLDAGKQAGTVRPEIGALDVMMMVKGVCAALSSLGDPGGELPQRYVDLVCAAISTPAHPYPLRGSTPTLADLDHAHTAAGGETATRAGGIP
jgi:AcrR family transcriptional regulator